MANNIYYCRHCAEKLVLNHRSSMLINKTQSVLLLFGKRPLHILRGLSTHTYTHSRSGVPLYAQVEPEPIWATYSHYITAVTCNVQQEQSPYQTAHKM